MWRDHRFFQAQHSVILLTHVSLEATNVAVKIRSRCPASDQESRVTAPLYSSLPLTLMTSHICCPGASRHLDGRATQTALHIPQEPSSPIARLVTQPDTQPIAEHPRWPAHYACPRNVSVRKASNLCGAAHDFLGRARSTRLTIRRDLTDTCCKDSMPELTRPRAGRRILLTA